MTVSWSNSTGGGPRCEAGAARSRNGPPGAPPAPRSTSVGPGHYGGTGQRVQTKLVALSGSPVR
ncbi:hypothetical protein GCM10018782_36550 [Streptomyces griseoaurantiacus]|nr:hypothetical protein GCM10018782_36550 [Streptomyces griseoaurantiacus]